MDIPHTMHNSMLSSWQNHHPQQVFGLLYISTQGALSLRSSSLLQLMLYTPPQSSDLLLLSLGIPQSNVQLLTLLLHIKVSNSEQPEGQWHRERIRRDGQVDGFLWILYKETCLFYLRNNESLNIRLLKMLQVYNASEFEGNTWSSWEDPRRLPNCDDNEFRFEAFNQMNNITGSPQNCATPEHWLGSPSDDLSRLGCSLVSAPLPCPCVFTFLCSDTVVGLKYFMQKLQCISDGLLPDSFPTSTWLWFSGIRDGGNHPAHHPPVALSIQKEIKLSSVELIFFNCLK